MMPSLKNSSFNLAFEFSFCLTPVARVRQRHAAVSISRSSFRFCLTTFNPATLLRPCEFQSRVRVFVLSNHHRASLAPVTERFQSRVRVFVLSDSFT